MVMFWSIVILMLDNDRFEKKDRILNLEKKFFKLMCNLACNILSNFIIMTSH